MHWQLTSCHCLRLQINAHENLGRADGWTDPDQDTVRADFWDCFDTTSDGLKGIAPGQKLVEAAQRRIDAFIEKWSPRYPAAMRAMASDRASLTVYLRFPAEHHKRIRHSNFIERTFGETRRRVKVIGRFPGETSCVSLV